MGRVTIYLMLFAPMVFSGCAQNTVYVDRIVEVKVPVKCVTPKTFCDKEGSLREGSMNELLSCIYELRESKKVCSER